MLLARGVRSKPLKCLYPGVMKSMRKMAARALRLPDKELETRIKKTKIS